MKIDIIHTVDGGYNVFGYNTDGFQLSGHLTHEELIALRDVINSVLMEKP